MLPDIETLHRLLRYDHLTGDLFWRSNEKIATHQKGDGTSYLMVRGQGIRDYAHRIAWALHFGLPLPFRIDHRDRDASNNRALNIRAATASQNCANCGPTRNGLKGVTFNQGKWHAQITYQRHNYYLGRHATEYEAARAYDDAARRFFGEFAGVNFPMENEQ